MNKNILKTSLLMLGATAGICSLNLIREKDPVVVKSDNHMFSDSSFVTIDNFAYSNLGFVVEIEFDIPSQTTTNTFNFMRGWDRLTNDLQMTFYSDGNVTVSVGKIIRANNKYYYHLMTSDLKSHLNTGERRDGHETLNSFFFKDYNVKVRFNKATVISTEIFMSENVAVRNETPLGMEFSAFVGKYDVSKKYGMIITTYENFAELKSTTLIKDLLSDKGLKYVDMECKPKALSTSSDIYKVFGNGYYINGGLVNIKEDNYQTDFVAIPYEKDASGSYKYGTFISETKTNFYNVCKNEKSKSTFSSLSIGAQRLVNSVVNVCENHVTRLDTNNVKAYFPYNSELIKKDAPLPNVLRTEHTVHAALGEKETGQLMLYVTKKDTYKERYYVSFDPFVNEDDPNEVLSSEIASIYQQKYIDCKSNWRGGQNSGWYPKDSPYVKEHPLGLYPDALLPFDVSVFAKENYIDNVEPNNGISYTINVPRGAKPGTYNSKIVVRIENEGTIALPIKLEVYPFDFPTVNKDKMIIPVDTTQLGSLYGVGGNSFTYLDPVYAEAYAMLNERGISGGQLPASYWSVTDKDSYIAYAKKVTLDDSISTYFLPNCSEEVSLAVKYKKSKYQTASFNLNQLVYVAKDHPYDGDSSIMLPGLETTLTELVKASTNEVDLLKKGIFYFPQADEPGTNIEKCLQNVLCENCLRRSIEYVSKLDIFQGKEKVKQSLLKLRLIVTAYPNDYLYSTFDENLVKIEPKSNDKYSKDAYCNSETEVWYRHMTGYCPTFESYQVGIPKADESRQSFLMSTLGNDEYANWWYGCIQPVNPYPSFHINTDIIKYRENQWWKNYLGIEGELYYMCNRTQDVETDSSYVQHFYPHTSEKELLENSINYEGVYGDGILLYPVNTIYGHIDNSLYWISTLRLDSFSEGIDDYNYLALARELADKLSSTEKEQYTLRINDLIKTVTKGPAYGQMDSSVLESTKDALASLIIELLN